MTDGRALRRGTLAGSFVVALIAACSHPAGPPRLRVVNGMVTGTPPAAAVQLAHRLFERAILPPGARHTAPPRPGTVSLVPGGPFTRNIFDLRAFWRARGSVDATASFLKGHVPAGMDLSLTGGGGREQSLVQELPHAGRGIFSAVLSWAIVPTGSATSLLRLDAQVVWLPARSAGEVVPRDTRAVVLTWNDSSPDSPTRSVPLTLTVTDLATVTRLAAIFNELPTALPAPHNCPAYHASITETAAFLAGRTGRPTITATIDGCSDVTVTVDGKDATPLRDSGRLGPGIDQLFGKS
jgi:hypothetical protein